MALIEENKPDARASGSADPEWNNQRSRLQTQPPSFALKEKFIHFNMSPRRKYVSAPGIEPVLANQKTVRNFLRLGFDHRSHLIGQRRNILRVVEDRNPVRRLVR